MHCSGRPQQTSHLIASAGGGAPDQPATLAPAPVLAPLLLQLLLASASAQGRRLLAAMCVPECCCCCCCCCCEVVGRDEPAEGEDAAGAHLPVQLSGLPAWLSGLPVWLSGWPAWLSGLSQSDSSCSSSLSGTTLRMWPSSCSSSTCVAQQGVRGFVSRQHEKGGCAR